MASRYMSRKYVHQTNLWYICDHLRGVTQECAQFKDDHYQKCADVYRQCAVECRKMAS
ncbi:hypothetical protein GCM10011571_28000 [Marinithermofilum abyssi]|uniref:Four-helix bundle copper-binding protein n=1 Tax=Marinithermofilum abyssi TaxID=1571185 RepID=A0A8J2VEB2_9BACL|nr:hypothetical protein GCM10011571_28000 [Marinithermofilum abyssi]